MAEKNEFDEKVEHFTYKPLQNLKCDDFSDVENWIKNFEKNFHLAAKDLKDSSLKN